MKSLTSNIADDTVTLKLVGTAAPHMQIPFLPFKVRNDLEQAQARLCKLQTWLDTMVADAAAIERANAEDALRILELKLQDLRSHIEQAQADLTATQQFPLDVTQTMYEEGGQDGH